MRIGRSYTFAAAHHLPHVLAGHKCGRVHGHTYGLEVELAGEPDAHSGWLVDYAEIDAAVRRYVLDVLDHHDLNDVHDNPTAENLVDWIFCKLAPLTWGGGATLVRGRLSESAYSWAERSA
jgi:6-pyruvoyltetrahydropterin/6-carboxytetrahydropterin synthase